MYISSALNCFRSTCQTNNGLCIAIYIWHKELHYYISKDSCVYFKSVLVCNVKVFITITRRRYRWLYNCSELHRYHWKYFYIKDSLERVGLERVFFPFVSFKKSFLFQNFICQLQDAAYLLVWLVCWCLWYSLAALFMYIWLTITGKPTRFLFLFCKMNKHLSLLFRYRTFKSMCVIFCHDVQPWMWCCCLMF